MHRKARDQLFRKAIFSAGLFCRFRLFAASSGAARRRRCVADYAGLRKKDVAELRSSSRSEEVLGIVQSKTGLELSIFEAEKLAALFDERDRISGDYVVLNQQRRPHTRDGLDGVFDQLKRELVNAKEDSARPYVSRPPQEPWQANG